MDQTVKIFLSLKTKWPIANFMKCFLSVRYRVCPKKRYERAMHWRSISRKRPPANLTCTSSGTQFSNIWIQLNYLCRSGNPIQDVGNAETDKSAYLLPYRPCIGAINAEILKGQCITDSLQSCNFYGFAIYATNNHRVKIVGLAVHCLNRKKCIIIILTQHILFWI